MLVEADLLTEYQRNLLVEGTAEPVVLGDYIILDRIGHGGMGQVYKARHRRMDRIVALKTLPDELAGDSDALARFHREVKAAARLSHPHIVTAHDAREDNGIHYLVMEYVPGNDLAKHVKSHGPMSPLAAVQCILQAAKGLEYAHQQGVVHRDVKPNNLLLQEGLETRVESLGMTKNETDSALHRLSPLDPRPVVKVLDMGLARIDHPDGDPRKSVKDLTASGAVMGTIDYMAPEQAENTHNADQRSDIYSLGMTFYFLLTGKTAYSGSTVMERLLAHREQPIPSLEDSLKTLNDLSGAKAETSVTHWRGLDDIFRKMVAKKPNDRYQTMSQLIAELEPLTAVMAVEDQTARVATVTTEAIESSRAGGSAMAARLDSPRNESAATSLKAVTHLSTDDDTLRDVAYEKTIQMTAETRSDTPSRIGSPVQWLALAIVLTGIAVAGIVYRIQTDHGSIIVAIEDESVAAQLTAAGLVVFDINDPDKKWTINLAATGEAITENVPSGDYQVPRMPGVELHITDSNGAEYSGREFKLTRGEEIRIRITAAAGMAVNTDDVDTESDRRAADYILSIGGAVRINDEPTEIRSVDQLPTEPFRLTAILLFNNKEVTDAGLTACEGCVHVTELDLRETPVTDAGLLHFDSIRRLTRLNLYRVGVTDAGLEAFRDCDFSGLQELLVNGPDVSDVGVAHFHGCDDLQFLHLGGVQNADAAVAIFQDCNDLRNLTFAGMPLTDAGLAHFHDCTNLEEVILYRTEVSDAGVAPLHLCKNLTRLSVERTRVTDEGLAPFIDCKQLLGVDVRQTAVSLEMIERFRQSLPDCSIIASFDRFAANYVLSIGGSVRIDDRLDEITATAQLSGEPFRLDAIVLRENPSVTDEGLAACEHCIHLKELDLGATAVTDEGLSHFAESVNLKTLALDETQVTDAGLEAFINCDRLTSLDVRQTMVTSEMVERYRQALPQCRIVTDSGVFDALPSDREAAVFVLSLGGHVAVNGDRTVIQSLDQLPQGELTLELVRLSENPAADDEAIAMLAGCRHLQRLGVYGSPVTDAGLAHLSNNPQWIDLILSGTQITDDGLALLRGVDRLKVLNLDNMQITDAGLAQFADCQELTKLIVARTAVTDAGLQHFLDCEHLTELNVEHTQVTAEGVAALHAALPDCTIISDFGTYGPQ